MLVVATIVTFIYEAIEVSVAQGTAGSFPVESSSSGAWSSSTGSEVGFVPATTVAEVLAQEWFTQNFWENVTQLAVGVDSDLRNLSGSDIICNGVPSLQRLSAETLPNFGCPDIFTAIDASCTCLDSGYNATDTWEFRVAKRDVDSEYPTKLTASDVLPVDAIRTLLVLPTLTKLRIIGDGDLPQDIQFAPEDRRIPGTTLPVAMSPTGTISISTVEIININMFSITLAASSFLPPTTTNLTLRNCNLFGFGFHFFDGVTNLQHLDLSSNSLTVPYAGSTSQSSCTNQFCTLKTLNLANNSLTMFPTVVFNIETLQELYIAQNDITDFNISNSTFNAIKSLTAFESDLPDASATCPCGTWQTVHSSKFCVANESIATPESSSGTCTQCIVYVGVIGACLVVALVVFLLWKRARTRRRASFSASSVSSPSSYYLARSGNETINLGSDKSTAGAMLEDPIIVTNRINYKEIKLGKCLSRGGFGPKVIHRDLKSKNVLLNMHLEAKLTDFGVSRAQYAVQTHAMTAGIGTSFWIAPEVLLGQDYNEQADIYSFGVVLSELDTDDYPFWNDSNRDAPRGKLQEADILRQVATGNKRPQFSPNCPAGVLLLAESCLQEKPQDRPTAAAIVETLQQLLHSSLQQSSSDSVPSFVSGSGWTAS
ncbi:hypothetical protein PHYPSEUDO_000223 [Phytophthora pseudosyringae]|uniref:Protein kinase domain-containing protein n=1 Tax=Phytophthora pseudosyringae TaxID=221518 RepID=A0A8T1WH34_9STRA|nr:hypothetical protein PHYPSEUDO_000223 [Phytophthora pseudosyringae]